ncbi:MAG: hypothetical protein Q8T08_00270 [Ignavibacteria bacterium]|nr:hypothetical protein [Ignavibacteria bacterium]
MKIQNTIEASTLKNLLEICGFNESISDLRFIHKEITHFVDLDAFTKEDQTSLYFFDQVTDLLYELSLLYADNHTSDDLELMDQGLSIIENIKNAAGGDLIKHLENTIDLAVFHIDFDRYDEKTRGALHFLKYIKEALTPLIKECFASEEIRLLQQQLRQSRERITELELQIKRKGQ